MPAESPTKWQVQAYRFGVRRIEGAVAAGDSLMRVDYGRRRASISVLVSAIVAAVALGAVAVFAFISPSPTIGKATVVVDSHGGGAYVVQKGRLYPALNLSSALLAASRSSKNGKTGKAGKPANDGKSANGGKGGNGSPKVARVNPGTIADQPRGPTLGIVGAPNALPSRSDLLASRWLACDRTNRPAGLPPSSPPRVQTTVLVGTPKTRAGSLGSTGGAVVSSGGTDYLLWSGRRSRIDPTDPSIALAFGFAGITPRPMSVGVLDAVPEAPPITVPAVRSPASQPSWAVALGVQVGEVFALQRADDRRQLYVALPSGVQQISSLVADLLRAHAGHLKKIPLVVPSALRAAPVAATQDTITLSNYPADRLNLVSASQFPVLCLERHGSDPGNSDVLALSKLPLPDGAKPVEVTSPGRLTADEVYLQPGKGAVFGEATVHQDPAHEPLFLLTDNGVRYPVVSGAALAALGLAGKVRAAPPQLLALLPQGPALDPAAAAQYFSKGGGHAGSLPTVSPASGT